MGTTISDGEDRGLKGPVLQSISFCCDRGTQEAGGSCSDRLKLEPISLPPAIKKAEKGKRAASLVTFPSCKSQPASLHTPASGANSRAGTWQTSSGTELPKEVGRVCVCAHTRVLAFFQPAGCFGEGEREGLACQLLPRSTERCL